jgi:NADPH2:quinone reductase
MRAVRVDEFGGPDRLVEVEIADPRPAPGHVLLSVAVAGVNRADVLARAGKYHRAGAPPLLLGLEAAGTVEAVGEGVTGFHVGQRVLATGAINHPGFYAELAGVPVRDVVAVPDAVDLRQAAGLPTAWISAWYCLHELAGLRRGETVLVHAGASGVGSAATQIARDAGATVIATASTPDKRRWVGRWGADHVLDSEADVATEVLAVTSGRGADVVLDTVGGPVFAESLRAAAYAGRVVALANVALAPSVIDTRDFYPKNVRILGFQITALIEHGYDARPDLETLLQGVAAGRFTVPIDEVFALGEAARAHRYLEERRNLGKVVLEISGRDRRG